MVASAMRSASSWVVLFLGTAEAKVRSFLEGRECLVAAQASDDRCWAAVPTGTHSLEGVGPDRTYAKCVTHSLDHEYNYFHLFERNLVSVWKTLKDNGMLEDSTSAVIFDDAVNVNLVGPWMEAWGQEFISSMTAHPKTCCTEVVSASSNGGPWSDEILPEMQEFMYKKAKLSLSDQPSASKSKKVCFLGRSTPGRARAFRNIGDLEAKVVELGYVAESLAFEGKTPLEQVNMVSECSVAIGIHGAGLTNFMWMRPGSTAIQIKPYRSSTGFISSYEQIALASGLTYLSWEPTDFNQVDVHWDQIISDKEARQLVCRCGVENIHHEGTMGQCSSDEINWRFYINQDIEVPIPVLEKLLHGDGGSSGGASLFENRVGLEERDFHRHVDEHLAKHRSVVERAEAELRTAADAVEFCRNHGF